MRIFVTGASGWIGSALVPELIDAGHQVVGLARSEASAAALTEAGAEVVRGTVDDLDVLRTAATGSDAVIHLAFKHDIAFSGDFQGAVDADRRAIDAFGEVLAGSDRPLVIASGTLGITPPGQIVTEKDRPDVSPHPRIANGEAALDWSERGVRSSVVRFAPTVHGEGDHGFVATLVDIARSAGASGYIDDGTNRWPAVHRQDAAALVRLAVEQAPAGSILHAIGEEGVTTRAIAEAIGAQLGLPVDSVPAAAAGDRFRFLAGFFGMDAPASNELTRQLLPWSPTGPTLLADLEAGYYTRPA
jgi:nucleoside-diphosphate-sugar epimerase